MLIEQIFEFDLTGPGLLSHRPTCTPTTGYFHDKTKISLIGLLSLSLLLKYCTRRCILFSPTRAQSRREGGSGGTLYPGPGLGGPGLKWTGRVQVSALSFGMAP